MGHPKLERTVFFRDVMQVYKHSKKELNLGELLRPQ